MYKRNTIESQNKNVGLITNKAGLRMQENNLSFF